MEIANGEDEPDESGLDDGENNVAKNFAEISLNVILGKSQAFSMKLQGKLEDKSILIIIDSGSTHNFDSMQLVAKFALSVEQISPFGVQIGNSEIVKFYQLCKNFKIQLPRLSVINEFYPFYLKSADLVLGIKWLASLNTI